MGKQTSIITFTGKLGNLIGYTLGDEHYVRSMPEHVERSVATKRSAFDFGRASGFGRQIRHALVPALDIPHDGTVTNRLNKELLGVLCMDDQLSGRKKIQHRYLPALTGFNFNEATKLDTLLPYLSAPVRDGSGNVHIAFKTFIKKNKNTTHVEVKAIVFGIDKQKPVASESIWIDAKAPVENKELIVPYAGNETAFVVLQVCSFEQVNGTLNQQLDLKFMAADIIGVLLPEREATASADEVPKQVKQPLFKTFHKQERANKGHSPPG